MQTRAPAFCLIAVAAVLLVAVQAPASPAFQDPKTAAEAQQQYEGRVEDWGDGPVQYLMTDDEEDLWDDLASDEAREAFKRWFWDRRDPDLRAEGNEMRDVFYTRVAEANDRFQAGGVFRGWESDRGRAWIVLGRPDNIQPNMGLRFDSEDWTYYTVARDRAFETTFGEFHILFVRPSPGEGYQVYDPFAGVGIWPRSVQDAFEYTRDAYIVSPDLERPAELPQREGESH